MTYSHKMIRTYTFQLLPNAEQKKHLEDALEATRLIYNEGLAELINYYKENGKYLNRFAHDKMHNKQRHPNVTAVLVDTTIARLHVSFGNFFRGLKSGQKIGYPRFKSKNGWRSFQFRDAQQFIANGRLTVPHKMGRSIKVNQHRDIEGKFLFARIIRKANRWHVQAVCEVEPNFLPASNKSIGLDFGLTSLIADSNGVVTKNPKHFRNSMKKLGKLQRSAAKKKKGSNRRRKAKALVERHHEHIANQRRDYLHKVARRYVNEYGIIAIEDLNVSGMVQSPIFSRSIHDASWGMLRTLLEEKAESAGRQIIAVAPQYTSQKCSSCGAHVQKSLSVRTHSCTECGYNDDRDVNAAKNILRLGLSLQGGVA